MAVVLAEGNGNYIGTNQTTLVGDGDGNEEQDVALLIQETERYLGECALDLSRDESIPRREIDRSFISKVGELALPSLAYPMPTVLRRIENL